METTYTPYVRTQNTKSPWLYIKYRQQFIQTWETKTTKGMENQANKFPFRIAISLILHFWIAAIASVVK